MFVITKIRNLLFNRMNSNEKLLRSAFNEEYYLETSNLDRSLIRDPFKHFMEIGWYEGKNPSPEFDVSFYLNSNPDVQQEGINPLLHYLLHGKEEERLPLPFPQIIMNNELEKTQYSADDMDAVKPFFDKNYYLYIYKDIETAKLDPLFHYMYTGWREYRNPCANFNTATYLQINKDVADAGINPLLHYANSGQYEDRVIKLRCTEELRVLEKLFHKKKVKSDRVSVELAMLKRLTDTLNENTSSKIIISLSHDDYQKHVGGIQIFIEEEMHKFREDGWLYLHMSPVFSNGNEMLVRRFVKIIANDRLLGIFRVEEVFELLSDHLVRTSSESVLTIHSLINFDENFILDLLLPIAFTRRYFWAHDYSVLCAGFNLLRNGISWCGLPPKDSVACYTCSEYTSREKKQVNLSRLIDMGFSFVTPSDAARNVLRASPLFAGVPISVVTHLSLLPQEHIRYKLIESGAKLRVAYCGHPVFHKGWHIFKEIVELSGTTRQYEFYHFGVHKTDLHPIDFVTVRNNNNSREAMVSALRENDIDIVVIPALWAETFCYVAYEALLAGALVVTLDCSGNVARLSEKQREVKVYPSGKAMVTAFVDNSAYSWAKDLFGNGVETYSSEFTGTTALLER